MYSLVVVNLVICMYIYLHVYTQVICAFYISLRLLTIIKVTNNRVPFEVNYGLILT